MCRLFGMSAAPHRVHATFWLLDAQDSVAQQSRRMPDGTGLGTFAEDGTPRLEKQPVAAYEDSRFAWEAKERESATFVAHVRYATTGANNLADTHPFEQKGRLFDHSSAAGTVRARSGALATLPAVVVATEQMDEDPDWESLCPGELLHVSPDQEVTRTMILERQPRHRLALKDFHERDSGSQP